MADQKTVLVVDDASLVRMYYRSVLEAAGFRVEVAFNGVEALEKLQTLAPDLLIVDVNMPQMDGLTFIDTLRRGELPTAATPALVTSTESAETDFAAAREAGANHYLVKPIDQSRLVEFVSLMCGVSR